MPARSCGHFTTGVGTCGAAKSVRQYIQGFRCPAHTPSALAGMPEPGARRRPAESVTLDQLLADAATTPVAEVLKAAGAIAPTGDAIVADVIGRRNRWLDEMTTDELRAEWRHYKAMTEWPHAESA